MTAFDDILRISSDKKMCHSEVTMVEGIFDGQKWSSVLIFQIRIAQDDEKVENISEAERKLKMTLDLLNSVNNLENLTPDQVAEVIKGMIDKLAW